MFLFYSDAKDDQYSWLTESEAIHCRQVLRKQIGDQVYFTDGQGDSFLAEIVVLEKKRVGLRILELVTLHSHRPYRVHIAIAPTKNIARFEWFLEKVTELGINEITPIICQRSERKVIKEDRCEKILISAMKQSIKSNLPKLNPLTKFSDFIKQDFSGSKFIAHLEEGTQELIQSYIPGNDVLILIGPEGDFTPEEIRNAKDKGFHFASLGDYRLRTETAGIVACQAIHFCNTGH